MKKRGFLLGGREGEGDEKTIRKLGRKGAQWPPVTKEKQERQGPVVKVTIPACRKRRKKVDRSCGDALGKNLGKKKQKEGFGHL